MKDMKMKTKMIIGFVVPTVFILINVLLGIKSIGNISSKVNELLDEEKVEVHETMEAIGADEAKAQQVTDVIEESQTGAMESIAKLETNSNIFSFALVGVSVIITVVIATSLIGSINKSVTQLANAAKDIAAGRVDIEMVKYNNDEFGELVDEYQLVINNTKNQAKIAEEVSHGNLTIEVTPASPDDVLGHSLKRLVDENHRVLSSISDAGYQVTIGASQVASASQSLAQGTTEQASAIEQITASIDEITEKTNQNASQANEAADLVAHAIQDVKEGNERMQDMMAAMEDINKSSESISKIIKVIDDIAFQTNILALNAAVEAARAGEAGKGFAVVAEEVRSLAAKSAAAASETAEMIEGSINKVNQGSKIADETAKALGIITEVVEKSEVLINNIAQTSNYQATAVAQVDQAISQVSQVVQTNSATSEQCAAASEELSNQASRMRDMLSIYQLGDKNAASAQADGDSYSSSANANEKIISLGDNFGKY